MDTHNYLTAGGASALVSGKCVFVREARRIRSSGPIVTGRSTFRGSVSSSWNTVAPIEVSVSYLELSEGISIEIVAMASAVCIAINCIVVEYLESLSVSRISLSLVIDSQSGSKLLVAQFDQFARLNPAS